MAMGLGEGLRTSDLRNFEKETPYGFPYGVFVFQGLVVLVEVEAIQRIGIHDPHIERYQVPSNRDQFQNG